MLTFPAGFRWGTATAAYQIEGATTADGRGVSIWDTYARRPGAIHEHHTGDVACDHYHRYADDVALMATLGIDTYRFSVSWPRILPSGTGPVNQRGLDFYDRLVDALAAAGIAPMLTLYHWDLPQALEDTGGWTSRDTARYFADYAAAVYTRLGDRVPTWTTLNEPWSSAFFGYAAGIHAPGRTEPAAAFQAMHHLLLAHGQAAAALRAAGAREVSIALSLTPVLPHDPVDPHDRVAADLIDVLANRAFLDPVLSGSYPAALLETAARFTDVTSLIQPEDMATIGTPVDLLGVNYYIPTHVAAAVGAPAPRGYPGADGVRLVPPTGTLTEMGWPIAPDGLRRLLERLSRDYPGVPLLITENGAAFNDLVTDGEICDDDRISYLDGHLRAAHAAIVAGANLRGYLVWSFLDNFEWGNGYSKRFGIVHIDHHTQRRLPKASAHWYNDVIKNNGLTDT